MVSDFSLEPIQRKRLQNEASPKISRHSYLVAYPSSTERKVGNHMIMTMIMIIYDMI
jgi:hypothetical protein